MLNKLWIKYPADVQMNAVSIDYGSVLIYLPKTTSIKQLDALYQQLLQVRFRFSFLLEGHYSKAQIESLIAFVFLPNFYSNGNKVILFLKPEFAIDDKKLLENSFIQQGYAGILFHEYCFQYYTLRVTDLTRERVLELYLGYRSLVIDHIETSFIEFIKFLYNDQMPITYVIDYSDGLEQEVADLKNCQQALEEENAVLKIHLQALKQSNQAKKIQAFYTKEYEVLPDWYKKVGQLLKLVLGKKKLEDFKN